MSSATAAVPSLKKVLFAADFSEYSDHALNHALAFTRGLGAAFYLTHVVSSMSFALAGPGTMGLARDAAWRDLTELEAKLDDSGALAGIPHHAILCQGPICSQIEQVVRDKDIDLLMVGTHGREGLRKLVVGSVAETIFRNLSCPVLVFGPNVRATIAPGETVRPQRILLATDFGPASLRALHYAASLANSNHGKIILLHVIPPLALTSSDSFWYLGSQLESMKKALREQTAEQLRKFVPPDLVLSQEPEYVTEVEFPVEGILRAATQHHADLILLGLRSKSAGTSSHNPWDIADRVICQATVPVMTVHA